jgi:hypothetical protein
MNGTGGLTMILRAATATTALALMLGACSQGQTQYATTRLDCPEEESGLKRVSQAADGRSCNYLSSDGAEVTLELLPVAASVDATLQTLEQRVRADIAKAPTAAALGTTSSDPAAAVASSDAAAAIAQAEADTRPVPPDEAEAAMEDTADWNADEPKGEHAEVDLPGIRIRADDESANVSVGPLHIDTDGGDAEIRMRRDVRLKGEALSREKRGVRATFVLAGEDLPNGYRFAGYEAGGPRKGPLTVAVVKGRDGGDHDDIYDAVKKLVRRNGGV